MNIWDKLTKLVLGLLVLAAILAIAVCFEPVIKQNQSLRSRKLDLDHKIAVETTKEKKLEAALHAMQDPKTVERLARERLSYAKPGEDVIVFEAPSPVSSSPAAPLQ